MKINFTLEKAEPTMFHRVDPHWCGAAPMEETLRDCAAIVVEAPGIGEGVVAYRWADSKTVEIVAAQGDALAGRSMLEILPEIEARAAGQFMQIITRRPGMMRALQRQGYQVAGVILRKEVTHGRRQ